MQRLFDTLKERGILYKENVSMASLCTFRIGGVCRMLILPHCIGELVEAVALCRKHGVPFAVLGRGSNMLFPDGVFCGALISTQNLNAHRFTETGILADCGVSLPRLAHLAASRGYSDLAFAAGIPGVLGGGLFMNAGAYGKGLCECLKYAKVYDILSGKITTIFNKELSYSYRKTDFQAKNTIILQAELQLTACVGEEAARAEIQRLQARRAATQPLALPSAGSAFLRPSEGDSMGRLLDELGLKGKRCGGAAVSEKHAGFIVNLGGATASDVLQLIREISDIVEKEKGFRPVPEYRILSEEL